MKIGELARRSGVSPTTIRYYGGVGVLPPPARARGQRDYTDCALDALRFVGALKRSGFTLSEIRKLRELPKSEQTSAKWRVLAMSKLDDLTQTISELRAAQATIEGALDCACDGRPASCTLIAADSRQSPAIR
ncbi:MAG: MerR family transcriptional regulator [Nannocystaceae bacterium]|nr:MerR family transcriptional regulator [Nannocystaceae bacterium]